MKAPRPLLLCDAVGGPMLVFANDSVIGRSIAASGQFGEARIDEVVQFLEGLGWQPRCFVDIGANIGTHVMYALDSGRFERAIVVEADPDNVLLLRANLAIRGLADRTTTVHCALSDRSGEVTLELCPSNYGDHRVRVEGVEHACDHGESARRTVRVPAGTADVLFDAVPVFWPHALVWMDTQGHEGHILAGGRRTLRALAPAVVMEFWPYGLKRSGGRERYFDFLASAGDVYDINRADWQHSGRVSVEELSIVYDTMLRETTAEHYPHTDLLCLRRGAMASDSRGAFAGVGR